MGKNAKSIGIIGGADGPTSVFIAGKKGNPKLSQRIRNYFYKKKRARVERKISANPHSIEEVIAYIKSKYDVREFMQDEHIYLEERGNLKESLIMRHKPELLGEYMEIQRPKEVTSESMKAFFEQVERRSQKAREISDEVFPMDFHIYEIMYDFGQVRIEVEKNWNELGISYSGNPKSMKKLKAVSDDIYLYYGVSQDDIDNRTQRYSILVTALSS